MVRTDYTGIPTNAPDLEAPNDYQHVEASPNAFGAPLAQGAEALGQSGTELSKFYGQVAADNATNNTITQATAVLRGDPNRMVPGPDGKLVPDTGYFGKRGADAMSAHQPASQDLDEIIQENRTHLATPEAQHQYDIATRRYRAQWANEMGEHYDQQFQQWAVNTNDNGIALTQNQIATHLDNPEALAQDQQTLRQFYVKKEQAQFGAADPQVTQGALLKADQTFYTTQIRAAIGTDPSKAQDILDKSGAVLASLPGYDGIVRQVKEATFQQKMTPAVNSFVTDALGEAQQSVHTAAATGTPASALAVGKPSPNSIGNVKDASGGFANPATPMDGVVLAANNLRSGYRGLTIAQIAQKWAPASDHNDPVAWAAKVGHAAGLAVGAVPNLDDPATLSAVVRGIGIAEKSQGQLAAFTPEVIRQGVTASLAGKQAALSNAAQGAPYLTVADALNSNMSALLDRARVQAEKLFPNYPDEQERFVQTTERRLNQTVEQQKRQYEVDAHIVQSAMAGPNPPISEDQFVALGPQVAKAWNSLQFSNPYVRIGIENRFNANSKGHALTYGTSSKEYFDRALAPIGDPTRISDPTQLNQYVGPGEEAALTNTGSDVLTQMIALRSTPQGEAFAAQAKTFIDQMHAELTFSNASAGQFDPKGEVRFSKAMAQITPKLMDAYKAGNLDKVLNPKDPDYLGNVAQTFARSPAQILSDRLHPQGSPAAMQLQMNNPASQGLFLLKEAVQQGRLTPQQAARIAVEHNFLAPKPRATPVAPVLHAPPPGHQAEFTPGREQ